MLPRSTWLAVMTVLVFAMVDNVVVSMAILFRLSLGDLASAFASTLVLVVCTLGSTGSLACWLLLVDTAGGRLTQQWHGSPTPVGRGGASLE